MFSITPQQLNLSGKQEESFNYVYFTYQINLSLTSLKTPQVNETQHPGQSPKCKLYYYCNLFHFHVTLKNPKYKKTIFISVHRNKQKEGRRNCSSSRGCSLP